MTNTVPSPLIRAASAPRAAAVRVLSQLKSR